VPYIRAASAAAAAVAPSPSPSPSPLWISGFPCWNCPQTRSLIEADVKAAEWHLRNQVLLLLLMLLLLLLMFECSAPCCLSFHFVTRQEVELRML
jgi:hypothetical protein